MPEQALPAEYIPETEETEPAMMVSPLDPDWILMLFFAIFVDLVDFIIILLGLLDIWTITSAVSWAIDGAVLAFIGGWMFWRIGQMVKSKKQRQEALIKKFEKQRANLKKLGKSSKTIDKALSQAQKGLAKLAKPFRKVLTKAGLTFLAETGLFMWVVGLIIGLIPFWTISVFLMLRERGE